MAGVPVEPITLCCILCVKPNGPGGVCLTAGMLDGRFLAGRLANKLVRTDRQYIFTYYFVHGLIHILKKMAHMLDNLDPFKAQAGGCRNVAGGPQQAWL